jgi:hypothetical protein
MVFFNGQMEHNIEDIGRTESSMGKEFLLIGKKMKKRVSVLKE